MPTLTRTIALGLATLAGLHSGLAMAIEDRDGNPIIYEKAVPVRPNPLGLKPVDAKALAMKRGGADVVNDMLLKGVVAGNRASDLTTGNNVIADGAAWTGTGWTVRWSPRAWDSSVASEAVRYSGEPKAMGL